MNRILVIGGAGFLGSILCKKLIYNGYNIKILDNLMYGTKGIEEFKDNDKFELIEGDIRNVQDILRAMRNVDSVIHLAAIVGDPASNLDPEETIEINHSSSKVIAGLAKYKHIKRFVFASTCSVYGSNTSEEPLSETSPTNPLSLYAKMKLKSEDSILSLTSQSFSPTIFRMATLYGISPRMRFDLVPNLFAINAIKKKQISLFGGEQRRCFCHVEDAANAYIMCLKTPIENIRGQIFNVSDKNLRIRELGEIIVNQLPGTKLIINNNNKDNRDYITTNEKIKNTIGWKPICKFEYFLERMKSCYTKWDDFETNPVYNNYEYLREKWS